MAIKLVVVALEADSDQLAEQVLNDLCDLMADRAYEIEGVKEIAARDLPWKDHDNNSSEIESVILGVIDDLTQDEDEVWPPEGGEPGGCD